VKTRAWLLLALLLPAAALADARLEARRHFQRGMTLVAKGDPVHEMLHTARKEDVDLIVIGHQADSGFVHRLFRGLSDNLLDHARRPVVVVPYSKVPSKVSASR